MSVRQLHLSDVRAVLRLVNELHARHSNPVVLRKHLLENLCRLVGADSGSALLTQIQPGLKEPRTLLSVQVGPHESTPSGAVPEPALLKNTLALARRKISPSTRPIFLAVPGRRRSHGEPAARILHCIRTPPLPSGDILVAGLLLRKAPGNHRPFSARHRSLVELVHSELGWIYQPHPPLAWSDALHLTPRQRQTLQLLLAGDSEK